MTDRDFTLCWVNEQRAGLGLAPLTELPPGRRLATTECPVATALGCGKPGGFVDGEIYSPSGWYDHPKTLKMPPQVIRFIKAFDDGLHPDLVAA